MTQEEYHLVAILAMGSLLMVIAHEQIPLHTSLPATTPTGPATDKEGADLGAAHVDSQDLTVTEMKKKVSSGRQRISRSPLRNEMNMAFDGQIKLF